MIYQVYGNERIEKIVFNVYPTDSIMYLSGITYCIVLIIFVPLYNISNTEYLERFTFIKKLLVDQDGETDRTRLVLFRWFGMGFFSALAMLTEDITVVLNLVGGLIIPAVSFYIPVDLNYLVFHEFLVCQGIQRKERYSDKTP